MLPGKKYRPEDIVQILRRRIWYILVPFGVVSAAAAVAARRLPDSYKSESIVLVVPQRVPEAYVKSTVTGRIEDRLQVIQQQIMSRTHLEGIIQDLNLYANERKRGGIMQDVVEKMRDDIHVTPLVKGDAVRVTYVGRDPQTVLKVTTKLASLFIDENLKDRTTLAQGTNEFLETQVEDARRRLQEQEKKLEAYRMRHSGELPTQLQSNMEALHNLQMQIQAVVEAINRQGQQKLLIEHELVGLRADAAAAAAVSAAAPPPADAAVPATLTTAQQLANQQNVLKGLQAQGKTDENPDVKITRRLIRDLQAKVDSEALERPLSDSAVAASTLPAPDQLRRKRIDDLQAEAEQLNSQLAYNQAEEKKMREAAADYQKRIDAVPARETEMVELTRDYTTLNNLYTSLLQKNEESKIAENLENRQIGEQFSILDPARLPEKPFSPNRMLINLAAMAAGLGLGLALVGFQEYRDRSFKTDDEVIGLLSLPVLAVVPLMQSASEQRRSRIRRVVLGLGLSCAVAACFAIVVYTFVR